MDQGKSSLGNVFQSVQTLRPARVNNFDFLYPLHIMQYDYRWSILTFLHVVKLILLGRGFNSRNWLGEIWKSNSNFIVLKTLEFGLDFQDSLD